MAEAAATFKDVPELFEVELGESLIARTDALPTFRELGPPDLVHIVKSTGRSGQRDLGSYHFLSGIDASSSASLAAYINSLTYGIEDNSAWFSKSTAWKLRSGTYCCFNAFSRLDIRVEVKIPGGVETYAVDLRGDRHKATPEMWQEAHVSALLRAILYSDDPNYHLTAYRRLNPISSSDDELRFLQGAEALFMKGWQVGSDAEIQVATVVSNHLTAGILKYFGDCGRYQQPTNLFEKLAAREPEIASLLAKSYIGMNEEVKAVQIMSSAMKQTPQSYTLLHVQSDFLRSKGEKEWALKLARQAVNCAPSEFVTWEKLAELLIDLGQYEAALLTLNSCPMFTYNGRDAHKNITPARAHLPASRVFADVLPEKMHTEDDEADPALVRLPAPGLRGTWARAYSLLTRLVSHIGWDELLKTRSAVFVMEEEYRMQKAANATSESVQTVLGSASINGPQKNGADDNASTKALHSPKPAQGLEPGGIPTIRISTDSEVEREHAEALKVRQEAEAAAAAATEDENANDTATEESATLNGDHEHVRAADSLEKPRQAAAGEPEKENGDVPPPSPSGNQENFSFSNKRLCERWLDNLFMVLYEDLRVWTIFRAEVAHFKNQQVAYRKTSLEWEILGDLGLRLHHKEESKEAFQRCLDGQRYTIKPWLKLMEMYADEGDLQRTLQTAIRVIAYQNMEYNEMTYPSAATRSMYKLARTHGLHKISFTLMSMGLPPAIQKVMDKHLDYLRAFKVDGHHF